MTERRALIIGADGQLGRYLGQHLAALNYSLCRAGRGWVKMGGRRAPFDLLDAASLEDLVRTARPDEIYLLAAYQHASEIPTGCPAQELRRSIEVNTLPLIGLLGLLQQNAPRARLFYASSSRVFGRPAASPQNEATPIAPICPYGVSKAAGMHSVSLMRDKGGLFASTGILYNHESPLRTARFLSRKVAEAAVLASQGRLRDKLTVGNLEIIVDWGHAEDAVRAMHAILALPEPSDFAIASGVGKSVRDFVECAFHQTGLDWRDWVREDRSLVAPRDGAPLVGDPSRLKAATGWKPGYSFEGMIADIIKHVRHNAPDR